MMTREAHGQHPTIPQDVTRCVTEGCPSSSTCGRKAPARVERTSYARFDRGEADRCGDYYPLPGTVKVGPQLVIVGELNPYGVDPRYALHDMPSNSAGWRLRNKILELSRREYLALNRHNLCTGRWDDVAALREADRLKAAYFGDYVFLLLGRKVATAFGLKGVELFTRVDSTILIPHPSGRCRVWNEPGSTERARSLIGQLWPVRRSAATPEP